MTLWFVKWLFDLWNDSLICEMTHSTNIPCVSSSDKVKAFWISYCMCVNQCVTVTHINRLTPHTWNWVMPLYASLHLCLAHIQTTCDVMAHILMSHGTHINESRHTYGWVMAHLWMSHGTHDNVFPVLWLIHMCAMTHLHVCHDTFICVPCARKCAILSVSRSLRAQSCHTYEWIMSHIWMGHVTAHESFLAHIWMRHVTHMNASWCTYEWVMAHI